MIRAPSRSVEETYRVEPMRRNHGLLSPLLLRKIRKPHEGECRPLTYKPLASMSSEEVALMQSGVATTAFNLSSKIRSQKILISGPWSPLAIRSVEIEEVVARAV